MGFESLMGMLSWILGNKSFIFIVSFILILLILTGVVCLILKKNFLLISKKFFIINASINSFIAIVFFKLFMIDITFYNIISMVFLVVIGTILQYFYWKKVTVPLWQNPRKFGREHIYHKNDWIWVFLGIIVIVLVFLIAYFFVIP